MMLHLPNPAVPILQKLASQCAVCHSWPAQRICTHCVARFAKPLARCTTCALALVTGQNQCAACVRRPPPLDACFAAVTYAYPWSGLITSYKFGQDPSWAAVFAQMMLRTPGVADSLAALPGGGWLLPMPLSPERLEARGFNQAWELVKALGRHGAGALQADARLLLRIRNTLPQSRLGRNERLRNVRNAFVVDPLRAPELQGRHLVLVDDVMTSGASLFSAAECLREAGAAGVIALVIARTE
jgi:ComF family protein